MVGRRRRRARHPEEPTTPRAQQAAERGCVVRPGSGMDKLKKVLSGQDTEDRGGLAEVSAPAAGRCEPGGTSRLSWKAAPPSCVVAAAGCAPTPRSPRRHRCRAGPSAPGGRPWRALLPGAPSALPAPAAHSRGRRRSRNPGTPARAGAVPGGPPSPAGLPGLRGRTGRAGRAGRAPRAWRREPASGRWPGPGAGPAASPASCAPAAGLSCPCDPPTRPWAPVVVVTRLHRGTVSSWRAGPTLASPSPQSARRRCGHPGRRVSV